MKRFVLMMCMFIGLFACNDDNSDIFYVDMQQENIHFTPIPGGAVMRYTLPRHPDVFAIHVRYVDAQGVEVLKKGGYGADSIICDGFNAPRTGVPARISLVNHKNQESEIMEMTFDTKESAAYAFFDNDNVEVSSFWGGFQVIYKAPEHVSGMVHVFYEGINPLTKLSDTLLLESLPIMKGGDTLMYKLEQQSEKQTIIVRTEDYRGYRVRQKVWKDVLNFESEQMKLTIDNYIPGEKFKTVKNPEAYTGVQYLFDGDLKGEQRLATKKSACVYTFVAGPGAVGQPFYIDLKDQKIPASIRMYAILNMGRGMGYTSVNSITGRESGPLGAVWRARYYACLPNEVTVYAGNDLNGDEASWTRIGYFYQAPDLPMASRWTDRVDWTSSEYEYNNMDDLNAAEPQYLEVLFPVSPVSYRYLKVVVNDTFHTIADKKFGNNDAEYVTMNELEVYVKKD